VFSAVGTPLLIKTQCTEVFPRVGVEYEFGDTKFTIPLMISGMDGKFTITDYLIHYISKFLMWHLNFLE